MALAGGEVSSALGRVFDELASRRSSVIDTLTRNDIDLLEASGVRVSGASACLDDDIELLSEPGIRRRLRSETTAWLRELEVRSHIVSTNTSLLARAERERIDGCVLTAEVQTAGRGRRDRDWQSPYGRNLAVSIGFALTRPLAELGALSLATGVAVRRALVEAGLSGIELKWPNDVLLEGRKLAGILIELVRASAPVEVVIGIGVNVGCRDDVAMRLGQPVADIAEQIARPSRTDLLARIVDRVAAAGRAFDAAGFEPFRAEWEGAHRYRGLAVVVTLPAAGGGSETVVGTALGVGPDGALRVDTGEGIREFTGGEVTLREDASKRPVPETT